MPYIPPRVPSYGPLPPPSPETVQQLAEDPPPQRAEKPRESEKRRRRKHALLPKYSLQDYPVDPVEVARSILGGPHHD